MLNIRKLMQTFHDFNFSNEEIMEIYEEIQNKQKSKGGKASIDDDVEILRNHGLDSADATIIAFEMAGITERNDI